MDLNNVVMNIFMFIGMIVCITVTAIALVYGVCVVVKILVKTFGLRVSSTCELMIEGIKEKKEAKKEKKKELRAAKREQQKELQKLKLESIARVGEMKKRKYQEKLIAKENKSYEKIFGIPNPNPYQPVYEEKVAPAFIEDVAEEPVVDENNKLSQRLDAVEAEMSEINTVETSSEEMVTEEIVAAETDSENTTVEVSAEQLNIGEEDAIVLRGDAIGEDYFPVEGAETAQTETTEEQVEESLEEEASEVVVEYEDEETENEMLAESFNKHKNGKKFKR